MPVTLKDVRAAIDPEEPNYTKAAKLGKGAIPHLRTLVKGSDPMLASKATYLASLIKDDRAVDVVEAAAKSDDPTVRVAAAAASANLTAAAASRILVALVADNDPGVRKVARAAVPARPPAELRVKLAQVASERVERAETPAPDLQPLAIGFMPGETAAAIPGSAGGTMPGEKEGGMPGEHTKMPGE